ncbi:Uncharacterised protein [Mycobacterium tuberculosis]|nr:Uncharacterised protein [Mycobacterium tuberculosis]CKR32492.1 Uncharacterised protein [Mycobacterium tuberculosis]CKR43431.1 Uncharacterised protein [Mycobacterium tuberculosis]CKU83391.1 Uncharacterised protein [Mycobacterium tuberculosis]CKV06035.1 Uncharacterised protein [Mycobacterium tuberculosis]
MFCPNRFDTANATSRARLAATSAGSTVAANAASKTPTTTRACPATASAAAATEPNHPAYGAAAAAIAAAAAPCHTPAVRPDVTCPNDTAADPNSSASPSHAAAAASNGLDPAPEYISTELISGGRTGKFNRPYLCRSRCVHTSSSHHDVVSAGTSTN